MCSLRLHLIIQKVLLLLLALLEIKQRHIPNQIYFYPRVSSQYQLIRRWCLQSLRKPWTPWPLRVVVCIAAYLDF